jgi:hypothetical protein
MFAADPRIRYIPASREQVVALHASLNKPHIAVPGMLAQEVQAFVVGAANTAGSYTLFVYLFLTQTREAVVYVDHERLRLDPPGYPEAEAEALAFVESMGFMVEPLNFRSLSSEHQQALMRTMPCFTPELRPGSPPDGAAPAARSESPQLKLARLLAAF